MTIWRLDKEIKPIYRGISEIIEKALKTGELSPGDRLPTHRDLADMMGINVSTVTKGYKEAEKRGLITGTTGKGTFIAFDAGYDISLHNPDIKKNQFIEFGLITPHFNLEPPLIESLNKFSLAGKISDFMDYGQPGGLYEHRCAGSIWTAKYGLKTNPSEILVTSGAQHALCCSMMSLFKSGDRIAVSNLTYPGIKSIAKMLGIKLTGIPMDEEGMTSSGLETACKRESIRGVYIMPGVQNPTTSMMGEERRVEIAGIIKKHNLILIEDDAYALTRESLLTPISSSLPDRSVFIAGVSKIVGAGLRVAFIAAKNPLIRQKISDAILNSMWMSPELNAAIISGWINDGTCDRVIKLKREESSRRYEILKETFKDYRFRGFPTGFFIWLELPEYWSGLSFEESAKNMGINIFCSEKFITGENRVNDSVRIALTPGKNTHEFREHLLLLKSILDGETRNQTIAF